MFAITDLNNTSYRIYRYVYDLNPCQISHTYVQYFHMAAKLFYIIKK
jgi:hypothetical protein